MLHIYAAIALSASLFASNTVPASGNECDKDKGSSARQAEHSEKRHDDRSVSDASNVADGDGSVPPPVSFIKLNRSKVERSSSRTVNPEQGTARAETALSRSVAKLNKRKVKSRNSSAPQLQADRAGYPKTNSPAPSRSFVKLNQRKVKR